MIKLKEYKLAEEYYQLAFTVGKKYYSEESILYINVFDMYSSYQIITGKIDEAEKCLQCLFRTYRPRA